MWWRKQTERRSLEASKGKTNATWLNLVGKKYEVDGIMRCASTFNGITLLVRKRSALMGLILTLAILNLFVFRGRVKSASIAGVAPDDRFQELRAALA